MKKSKWFVLSLCLLVLLAAGLCVQAEEEDVEAYTIGVVVYDPDSAEMEMFMDYYRDYLQQGFPVKFYFSDAVTDGDQEIAFIDAMKENGADGIISFLGNDLQRVVAACEKNEMYYVLGSNMPREDAFEAVKDNPWFLGSVGPEMEDVYQSGCEMAEAFLEKGAKTYVIMTGGAVGAKNPLHTARVRGMLDVLQEKAGLVLDVDTKTAAAAEENTTYTSADGSIQVTLCPGYTENGDGLANLDAAFAAGTCDALMSAFHVSTYIDRITAKEKEQNQNMLVGAIDSFTEANFEVFQEKDPFGNAPIDYTQGKYGSMAGPAFAMLYNAMSGHPEANTEDGKAVQLYQSFWTAQSWEEYYELYSYTTGIYENAYSCEDLMQVIRVYSEDASPEHLRELTEACTIEAVKARILE